MRYLLDADVLIRSKNQFYPFEIFPCFWRWLDHEYDNCQVMSIDAVRHDIMKETDRLRHWAKVHGNFFLSPDAKRAKCIKEIVQWIDGNAQYITAAKQKFYNASDLSLIAHALAHDFTVVTLEQTHPDSSKRIMIPDVCDHFGVKHNNIFQLLAAKKPRFEWEPPNDEDDSN